MNVPNRLTILRVAMIPAFILFMLWDSPYSDYLSVSVFILACVTDFLDGYLARKYNQITTFGKFMDPLADKLLVCSALICLIELQRIPSWMVVLIIAREFTISGFRLIAADNGVVIAASYFGKFKTTFQMIAVCLLIADIEALQSVTLIILWIAVILTVVSLVDYLVKNKDVMKEEK